jgi:hypothetical protein
VAAAGPAGAYRVRVDDNAVIGGELLADRMHIAVRLRRDFTVTTARRLPAAARAAYLDLNPGATAHDAAQVATSAAEAIFTPAERDGPAGQAIDALLAAHAGDGLQPGRWRAQLTTDQARRLPAGPDRSERHDVYAPPADA